MSLLRDLQVGRYLEVISQGALISFVPTIADGMSPVLQRVDMMICNRYALQEQLSLWP